MDPGGEIIRFDPTDNDVVSTKLRSWNLGHPGNLEYAELLLEYARKMPTPGSANYGAMQNQYANRIVEVVQQERGGRFLKIQEGESYPAFCQVMDHRASIHKVFHGIKNKHVVILKKGMPGKPTKEQSLKQQARLRELKAMPRDDLQQEPPTKLVHSKAPPQKKKAARRVRSDSHRQHNNNNEPPPVLKKRKRRKRNEITGELMDLPEEPEMKKTTPMASPVTPPVKSKPPQAVIRYEAQQGEDGKINPYALELISYVCNNETDKPHAVLEEPVSTYADSTEGEPDKERRIRLQLRHRIFAAKAIQMPVVDFARKILEIWGGTLSEVEEQPEVPVAVMPSRHSTRKRALGENTPNDDAAVPQMNATNSAGGPTHDNDNTNDATMREADGTATAQSRPGHGNLGGGDGNDSDSSSDQRATPGKAVSRGVPQKEPRRASTSLLDTANYGNGDDMDNEQENGIASALWRSDGNHDDDDDGDGSEIAADESDANSGEEESENNSDESEEEQEEDGESEAGYGTANEQLSGEDSGSDENFEEEERSIDEDDDGEGDEENESAGDENMDD